MADLEERVQKLEDKMRDLDININKSLTEIKVSLAEISTTVKTNTNSGDLKNEVIKKDIDANKEKIIELERRVKDQEDSKKWLVRLVFATIIGLLFEAVAFYIKTKS